MDAAAIRRQREEMRKQWMAQRAVEKDREAVLSQMGVAPPPQQDYIPSCFEDKPPSRDGSSVASSAMMHPSQAGEMITRMTERISDRLREELMIELRREQLSADDEKQAIGTKVEEMLNDDLSANTCLICCELMAPPERAPMMLFPCGHTFCASCLKRHKSDKCAYCRQTIQYKAVNHSLQTMIQGFMDKRRQLETPSEVAQLAQPGNQAAVRTQLSIDPAASESAGHYKSQYQGFEMRVRVLREEGAQAAERCSASEKAATSSRKALSHLATQEEEVLGRLQALQQEHRLLRDHIDKCEARILNSDREAAQAKAQVDLVDQTIEPLILECDKTRLLFENFGGNLAELCFDEDD